MVFFILRMQQVWEKMGSQWMLQACPAGSGDGIPTDYV